MFPERDPSTCERSLSCNTLKSIVVSGLHKQTIPKTVYRFAILVTYTNGSCVMIYRKNKEIKWFQNQLDMEISSIDRHTEAMRYLSKLKKKTRSRIVGSAFGTSKRLRMIDAFNMYFDVVTYYFGNVDQVDVLKYFLSPSKLDKEASVWSKTGKFFTYSSNNTRAVSEDMHASDLRRYHSCGALSTLQVQIPQRQRLRKMSSTLSLIGNAQDIYIAEEDHVPREVDLTSNVIGLQIGDEVNAIFKSETGWWFVQKLSGTDKGVKGYVAGSYLKSKQEVQSEDFLSITNSMFSSSDPSNGPSLSVSRIPSPTPFSEDYSSDSSTESPTEPFYETVCYPLSYVPRSEMESSNDSDHRPDSEPQPTKIFAVIHETICAQTSFGVTNSADAVPFYRKYQESEEDDSVTSSKKKNHKEAFTRRIRRFQSMLEDRV